MRSFLILSLLSFLHTGAYSQSNAAGKDTVIISGKKATVWASSTLQSRQTGRYSVKNAFDGDSTTAWVEGVEGDGAGESITVEFLENVTVKGFLLFPGYTKSVKTLIENVIPTSVTIVVDGKHFSRYDIFYSKTIMVYQNGEDWDCVPDDPINLNPRFIIFDKPIVGKLFELQIVDVLAGVKYRDLAISEWIFSLDENKFKPRRTDYEKILSLLSDFAKGNLSGHLASGNVFVENLLLLKHFDLTDLLGLLEDHIDTSLVAPQNKKYQDHLISQLESRGGGITDPPLQIFLRAEHSDFINNVVMAASSKFYNEHYLIGANCFAFDFDWKGWVLVHPLIVLNREYKIIELRTLKCDRFPTGSLPEGSVSCGTFSIP